MSERGGLKEHALPLGISFFVFHAISYLVDSYRGIVKTHSWQDFATYFFMFPHLVAGPIVRFEMVRSDIQNRSFHWELFSYGVFRFILGVNKKILIANSVAPLADIAFFSHDPTLSTCDAWIGILAYSIQIYFDFSGYSDMAIGLAAMIGIRFAENFQSPYQSHSIKEFWRRWHISLSTWFRDYLYIPLGGSRCSQLVTYSNLVIVFVLCGLWHGAQFTFLVWGLFHGALLIFERIYGDKIFGRTHPIVSRAYCLFMILIGWVFFRSVDLTQAFNYLSCMFDWNTSDGTVFVGSVTNIFALIVGTVIALFGKRYFEYGSENYKRYPICVFGVNICLFFVSMMILYTNSRNPFIYFNF